MLDARELENSGHGVLVADLTPGDTPIIYANAAAERITGYSSSEIIGRNCRFLQGSDRDQPEIAEIRAAIAARTSCIVTLRNYRKGGGRFWNELRLFPLIDAAGTPSRYMATLQDVSDVREAKEWLERLASLDTGTGLSNRATFIATLQRLLADPLPAELAVAKFDLEPLRDVANTFGVEASQAILSVAAERLRNTPSVALLGHLGDGMFVITLPAADAAGAETMISEISRALASPYAIAGTTISLHVGTGYTLRRGRQDLSAADALREASFAAAAAARSGPGEIRMFDRTIADLVRSRLRLTSELQLALAEQQFDLHYQPKVDIASGHIIGAEALLRWRHPVFGLQPPGRFLGVAEESGLITEIGQWAIREAACFARRVNQGLDREHWIQIAVNVSSVQFRRADVTGLTRQVLAESGAEPCCFCLELTETVFADASPQMLADLSGLRALGVGLALDDFGTGYSSFHYLRDLPLSELKIDRSFVGAIDARPRNQAIVRALLRLADDLGLDVTCEGVETCAERETLRALRCPTAQGFYYCPPIDDSHLSHLVAAHALLPPPR